MYFDFWYYLYFNLFGINHKHMLLTLLTYFVECPLSSISSLTPRKALEILKSTTIIFKESGSAYEVQTIFSDISPKVYLD